MVRRDETGQYPRDVCKPMTIADVGEKRGFRRAKVRGVDASWEKGFERSPEVAAGHPVPRLWPKGRHADRRVRVEPIDVRAERVRVEAPLEARFVDAIGKRRILEARERSVRLHHTLLVEQGRCRSGGRIAAPRRVGAAEIESAAIPGILVVVRR